jgi:hypothetical protein
MTEQTVTLPADPPPPPVQPAAPQVRRALGLPIVAAIAGATLLTGGLAGGIVGYAVHSDGPDSTFRQGGPGQRFQQGAPGNGQLPQPPNGQGPGQSQQQDDGSDSGSDS